VSQHVRCPGQILQGQFEKDVLHWFVGLHAIPNGSVITGAFHYGMIENRWIRRQTSNRQFFYVPFHGAAVEKIACDVIQPKTLAHVVKFCGCFHGVTFEMKRLFIEPRFRNRRGCMGGAYCSTGEPKLLSREAWRTFEPLAPRRVLRRCLQSSMSEQATDRTPFEQLPCDAA
jgi:hypothetical protein